MTFVIGASCADSRDTACLAVCPVDCIYDDGNQYQIDEGACINCGACEPECPSDSIREVF